MGYKEVGAVTPKPNVEYIVPNTCAFIFRAMGTYLYTYNRLTPTLERFASHSNSIHSTPEYIEINLILVP